MPAVTDFSKPPEEVLVELIKDANPTLEFEVEDVIFDSPTVTSGADAEVRDTKVLVRGTETGRFIGVKDVIYDRVPLTEVLRQAPDRFVERVYQGTLRDLIPLINERFGIVLRRTDIVDQVLPNVYGDSTLSMQASATSLIYKGSVNVTVRRSMALEAAITDRQLNGITHVSETPQETAQNKLLVLLNAEQTMLPYTLTLENVSFGNPSAAAGGETYNTRVPVVAKRDMGYLDQVEVFYRRVNLASIMNTTDTGVSSVKPLTPQKLLDKLNVQLSTFLRLGDLEPITIPEMTPGTVYNITLQAKSNSLGFHGVADIQAVIGFPDNADAFNNAINVLLPEAT